MFNSKFLGILKHPGYNGGKGGSAPSTPDFTNLAKQQAASNLDLAKYTTEANRVNQVTPYGNITYSQGSPTIDQAGYDAALASYNQQLASQNNSHGKSTFNAGGIFGGYGGNNSNGNKKNSLVAPNIADYTKGSNTWTATQSLSPAEQKILEANQGLSTGKLGYAQDILNKAQNGQSGVDTSQLPSYGINPGETYSDAIMRRLQPQQAQAKQSFDAQMANQGVMPGTQAYDNAYRNFSQGQNDQLTSAITGGMGIGLQANQQAFNQGITNMNQPINMVNSLQNGSQVTNPQGVNSANMPQVAGPDLTGAAQNTYNSQLANYNAQNAASGNFMGGLLGLGGAALGAPSSSVIGKLIGSDQNIKENISKIGAFNNGINIYKFDYKPEYKDTWGHGSHIGVMAQEVEKVIPEAVAIHEDGYKLVNYAMLGA
jgi:hypothetical protein